LVARCEPGDVLAVPDHGCETARLPESGFRGPRFRSNAAAWWGFQYNDLLTAAEPREVITIYELDATGGRNWARAGLQLPLIPQTDPFGVVHPIIDTPECRSTMRWSRKTTGS